jgi:hypothetical protein
MQFGTPRKKLLPAVYAHKFRMERICNEKKELACIEIKNRI